VLSTPATRAPPVVAALTLDLDDTLWPIAPIMARCEQVLHDYLSEHAPIVATRFPVPMMRALRDRVFEERPELAHDYAALRRLSLERAFDECGHVSPAVIDDAYALFYATRNEVQFYDEVAEALPAIARRHRIVALTNGNADLGRIGLIDHFHGAVFAREFGCAKPDGRIFAHACALLDVDPAQVWHIGDDADLDVVGAHQAGLRTVWLNRDGRDWPYPDGPHPDLTVRDLVELDTWLAAHTSP
jgi:HAD superfamily hydrolase (TIGR01509 family)